MGRSGELLQVEPPGQGRREYLYTRGDGLLGKKSPLFIEDIIISPALSVNIIKNWSVPTGKHRMLPKGSTANIGLKSSSRCS